MAPRTSSEHVALRILENAERDVGRDGILIGIGPDDEPGPRLASSLENTQPCRVRILKDHVDSPRQLRECLLLASTHIIPVSDVGRHELDGGVDRMRSLFERPKTFRDGRKLCSTDHAERMSLRD